MTAGAFDELAAIASRQLGLVTAGQAGRAGIGAGTLAALENDELLSALDWSVYQLTDSDLAPRQAYPYAAWLALAPRTFAWERPAATHQDAVVSHESAAQLYGLGALAAAATVFTAPHELPAVRGIEVRVAGAEAPLTPEVVTVHEGVPVTVPRRVVADLVRGWTEHRDVQRVLTAAVRQDLVDLGVVYADLVPLAERHGFAVIGAEFAGYFLDELDVDRLSERNRLAYARLTGEQPADRDATTP